MLSLLAIAYYISRQHCISCQQQQQALQLIHSKSLLQTTAETHVRSSRGRPPDKPKEDGIIPTAKSIAKEMVLHTSVVTSRHTLIKRMRTVNENKWSAFRDDNPQSLILFVNLYGHESLYDPDFQQGHFVDRAYEQVVRRSVLVLEASLLAGTLVGLGNPDKPGDKKAQISGLAVGMLDCSTNSELCRDQHLFDVRSVSFSPSILRFYKHGKRQKPDHYFSEDSFTSTGNFTAPPKILSTDPEVLLLEAWLGAHHIVHGTPSLR